MKTPFFTLLLILCCLSSNAQTWQALGPDNRDELGFAYPQMLSSKIIGDTIYAALLQSSTSTFPSQLILKKYNGQTWDSVGNSLAFKFQTNTLSVNVSRNKGFYTLYRGQSPNKYYVQKCINGSWNYIDSTSLQSFTITPKTINVTNKDSLYILCLTSNKLSVLKFNGTQWDSLGNTNFANTSGLAVMNFDTSGVPYVAFADPYNLNRATVMKFNGTAWTTISPSVGLSTLGATNLELESDANNNDIYLKLQDAALGNTVKKYDGNSWTNVGIPGFFTGTMNDLVINQQSTPYLCVKNNDSLWVMKYDGANWINTTNQLKKNSSIISMDLIQDTIPALGYSYTAYDGKPVISTYNGTGWNKVGVYGFVDGGVYDNTSGSIPYTNRLLTIVTSDNVPHIVFSDSAYSGRLSMMNYTNGTWNYEGTQGFTSGIATPLQLEKGKNDTIYLMYIGGNPYGQRIAYFDGTNFIDIPSSLTNQYYPTTTSFTLDTSGIPTVMYPDPTNFNIATLKKYTNGSWTGITSLPCTTAVQMKIDKKNQVVSYYPTTINNVTTYNLVKFINGNWTTPIQSTLNGVMKIAPNDSVFLSAVVTNIYSSGGGIPIFTYSQTFSIYQLVSNTWNNAGTYYNSPTYASSNFPPALFNNYIFDSNSIPYILFSYGYSSFSNPLHIYALANGLININTPSTGWDSNIIAKNIDMAFDNNNKLIATYSYGTAYAMSFQAGTPPPAPQIVSPISYCQGDSAAPLIATGQNLVWNNTATTAPTPPTNIPDTFYYSVKQYSGIYPSPASIIMVIVNPKPNLNVSSNLICAGDTFYLSTTAFSNTVYHWTNIQTISGQSIVNAFDSTNIIGVTDSGSYVVTTSLNGCSSDTVTISLLPVFSPSITITGPGHVSAGQDFMIVAGIVNAGNDYLIDWYKNGVLFATTNTDTFHYIMSTGEGSDTFQAVIRGSGTYPCYKQDTSNKITVDEITGLKNLSALDNINVYPNPFSETFTVSGLKKGNKLRLYSTDGKLVQEWNCSEESLQLFHVKNILSGNYILKVITDKNTLAFPLSKF